MVLKTSGNRCGAAIRCMACAVVFAMGSGNYAAGGQAPAGSFSELLQLKDLPLVKSWRTYQASGYDRGGGFYDSGNVLRIENERDYVLMDAKGPGCIDRMWFTYKKPMGQEPYNLRIYIDDEAKAVIDVDLDTLFSGKMTPFVAPLAGCCGLVKQPGRYSYVPIGFSWSCKVVVSPTRPPEQYTYRTNSAGQRIPHFYYQITWRKFKAGTAVRTFTWDLNASERSSLGRVIQLLESRGQSPWGELANIEKKTGTASIRSKGRVELFRETGAGTIYSIRLKTEQPGGLGLEMTWDGASKPQVLAALGPFFACDASVKPSQDVKGLWVGFEDGFYYCYLPMPYRKQACISLVCTDDRARAVDYEIDYQTRTPADDAGWFCASRYDFNPPEPGKDYVPLDVEGAGGFVGIVMDRPGQMEGDDQFFVDGQQQSSIHGTGTEDFFNFAWGLSHTGTYPLHGITIQNGHPVAYRFHTPAEAPFSRLLRITWEHGHDSRLGPDRDQGRYSGVVMYYLMPEPRRKSP